MVGGNSRAARGGLANGDDWWGGLAEAGYSAGVAVSLPLPSRAMTELKIRIITTGGTIDKIYFDATSTYEVGASQVVPVLTEANVSFDYIVEQACQKDSLELCDDDRADIRRRVLAAPERCILIIHGTDTMTETAKYLADIPDKVIVFTGAMAPARFRASDAPFNFGCAVAAVQLAAPGVYIAMNGRVFPGASVRKNREKGRFEPI